MLTVNTHGGDFSFSLKDAEHDFVNFVVASKEIICR